MKTYIVNFFFFTFQNRTIKAREAHRSSLISLIMSAYLVQIWV